MTFKVKITEVETVPGIYAQEFRVNDTLVARVTVRHHGKVAEIYNADGTVGVERVYPLLSDARRLAHSFAEQVASALNQELANRRRL